MGPNNYAAVCSSSSSSSSNVCVSLGLHMNGVCSQWEVPQPAVVEAAGLQGNVRHGHAYSWIAAQPSSDVCLQRGSASSIVVCCARSRSTTPLLPCLHSFTLPLFRRLPPTRC